MATAPPVTCLSKPQGAMSCLQEQEQTIAGMEWQAQRCAQEQERLEAWICNSQVRHKPFNHCNPSRAFCSAASRVMFTSVLAACGVSRWAALSLVRWTATSCQSFIACAPHVTNAARGMVTFSVCDVHVSMRQASRRVFAPQGPATLDNGAVAMNGGSGGGDRPMVDGPPVGDGWAEGIVGEDHDASAPPGLLKHFEPEAASIIAFAGHEDSLGGSDDVSPATGSAWQSQQQAEYHPLTRPASQVRRLVSTCCWFVAAFHCASPPPLVMPATLL